MKKPMCGLIGSILLVFLGCTAPTQQTAPRQPQCRSNQQCPRAQPYCFQGSCRSCVEDKQCGNPCRRCDHRTFSCVVRAGCCSTDLDCPGGRCWLRAGSLYGKCGDKCRRDADCPARHVCRRGGCQFRCDCVTDAVCPARQRCVNCQCVADGCYSPSTIKPALIPTRLTTSFSARLKSMTSCSEKAGRLLLVAVCPQAGSTPGVVKTFRLALRRLKRHLLAAKVPRKGLDARLVCPKKSTDSDWRAYGKFAGRLVWSMVP